MHLELQVSCLDELSSGRLGLCCPPSGLWGGERPRVHLLRDLDSWKVQGLCQVVVPELPGRALKMRIWTWGGGGGVSV